jgi:glycosyltransferase involved in cell wall biosynthesis
VIGGCRTGQGKRVCLVTTGQPSNNPRLVKEADALSEAGYAVHAICCDCGLWPSMMDKDLTAGRDWTYEFAAGSARSLRGLWRRTRYKLFSQLPDRFAENASLNAAAISPVGPELHRAATRFPADLYIAHHPTALPAVTRAAARYGAKAGFDAEDLHTGQAGRAIEGIERKHIPRCDYVTTAAPGFSLAYRSKYAIDQPSTILNVFPLSERPKSFRPSAPGQPLRLYWFSQRIGESRGLEDAVRALGRLRDLPVELHLRGDWQAGYKEQLFSLAAAEGVDSGRIRSYAPAAPDQMVRLASEYDIGLALEQPVDESHTLCLSNKFFVYLLAGIPVAATASRGQKPVVETLGEAAFCYENGDAQGLANGIRKWSIDRQLLNTARERAWRWGTEKYNWDIEKIKFLEVVESVFRTPRPESTASRRNALVSPALGRAGGRETFATETEG